MTIDLRDYDQREHSAQIDQRLLQPVFDLQFAQAVREKMRAQGLRVPLTDDERFAEADRRMRDRGGEAGATP